MQQLHTMLYTEIYLRIVLYAKSVYPIIYSNLSDYHVSPSSVYTLIYTEMYLIIMICATSVYHVIY